MKRTHTLAALLLLSVSAGGLGGCATSYGTKIEADNVSKIVKGKTTRDEVLAWFGQPMQTIMMPDGGRTMYFIYYRATIGNSIYGQIPSTLMGKGKAKTGTNLSVLLDANGIVKDFEYAEGSK